MILRWSRRFGGVGEEGGGKNQSTQEEQRWQL